MGFWEGFGLRMKTVQSGKRARRYNAYTRLSRRHVSSKRSTDVENFFINSLLSRISFCWPRWRGYVYIIYCLDNSKKAYIYYHGRQMICHCFLSSPMFHCVLLHKLADNRNNILLFVCAFFSLSLDIVQLRKKECLRT